MAGLPKLVIHRAGEVLRALEEGREGHKPLARIDDLPLFATELNSRRAAPERRPEIEDALRGTDLDALTPKAALELLYSLKRTLRESED